MSEENFKARIEWAPKNKAFKYNEYSRDYIVHSESKPDFVGTAAPSYLGSLYHYNPEDLMVVSLSACHMLTYLAYAANSKITVLSYTDDAEGNLHKDGKVMKFEKVILKPKVMISKDSPLDKAVDLHKKAHQACFIANSVNFETVFHPEVIQES